jgi:hypothetical protein
MCRITIFATGFHPGEVIISYSNTDYEERRKRDRNHWQYDGTGPDEQLNGNGNQYYWLINQKGGTDMKKKQVVLMGLALMAGCVKVNDPDLQQSASETVVAVSISADYAEGNMGSYCIADSSVHKNLLAIHSDNDIRVFEGSIYVLERYGKDNLIKITGPVIADTTVVYQKNIGASVNIQDIAFVSSTKAYVTQYASSHIVIVDPATGSMTGKTIDLSKFNTYAGTPEATSVPNMTKALFHDGKVYVACQRLKAPAGGYLSPADTSLIVVINAVNDSVENAIRLRYKNPQEMCIVGGTLYVASCGAYGANDGGIECIDCVTGTNSGSVADENALHGDVQTLIVVSETKGYAVVSTPAYTTELYPFNPQTKAVGAKVTGIDAPCSNHIAYDGTRIYVGDRSTTAPGIVIIDPATDSKVGTTKNIGVPPNSLAFVEKKK